MTSSSALSGRRFEDRLTSLREKATPGPWVHKEGQLLSEAPESEQEALLYVRGVLVERSKYSEDAFIVSLEADAEYIAFLSPSRSKLVEEVIRAARTQFPETSSEECGCVISYVDESRMLLCSFHKALRALDASLDSGGETDDVVSAGVGNGGSPE